MDTVKVEKKGVKMIAHRGLSGIEKENTIAAFIAAGNRSYYGIETDVHKTADGKFVIIHDDDTARVSNENISVEKSRYEDLSKITLNDFGSSSPRCDLKIPQLAEYISVCKKYEKKCVLELKNAFEKEDIEKIINIIKGFDYLEEVIFISFDLNNLIYIRELLPNQTAQYLLSDIKDDSINTLIEYKLDLDVYYSKVTPELVDKLHKNNLKINCWTCDDAKIAEKLVEYGVDYITSNILE